MSGVLEIITGNAEKLLRAAHLLQLPTVITICCEYLEENLTPSNCLRIWMLAEHLGLKEFERTVFKYCLQKMCEIPVSEYVELEHEELDRIIRHPNFNIQAESKALDVIMNWIQHKPSIRIKEFQKLATSVDIDIVKKSVSELTFYYM